MQSQESAPTPASVTPAPSFTLADILSIIPHRPPFLFVDRVTGLIPGKRIDTERELRPEEWYFQGHFPGTPVMPGVLMVDGLAQTAGLLHGLTLRLAGDPAADPGFLVLASVNVKFLDLARPGDTLTMTATPGVTFGGIYRFGVHAMVGRRLLARGELTLAQRRVQP
jgi:3-hydroxyacyl-[acyl-carrier-protein] dehydratase